MNRNKWKRSNGALVALVLFFCANAHAQQIPRAIVNKTGSSAYDVTRESVITGKVLQYRAASKTAPAGAHISLQTSSGTLDIHAGNAKLIAASHLFLQAGDSVSITGETVALGNGTIFVARIIQKGTQSVAVRSKNGMPLLPTARSADGRIVPPGGVR